MKLLNKDEWIANELKYDLFTQSVREGDRLPSESEIIEKYSIQKTTAKAAYHILEQERLIETGRDNNNLVSHSRFLNPLQGIPSQTTLAEQDALEIRTELLSFGLVETERELAEKLNLSAGTLSYKIMKIRQLVRADGQVPLAIDSAYIFEEQAPKLFRYNIETTSLLEILEKEYGRIPGKEEHFIEVVSANAFEAENLHIEEQTPLIKSSGITYDIRGNILQCMQSLMNRDWVAFTTCNPEHRNKTEMDN